MPTVKFVKTLQYEILTWFKQNFCTMITLCVVSISLFTLVRKFETHVGRSDGILFTDNGALLLDKRIFAPTDALLFLQQSICSEMAEEFRFAIRCYGSQQRPALKRQCSRCAPSNTYVPAANGDHVFGDHPNGMMAMQMVELRKSPVIFDSSIE